jgi:hypothetical protein
MSIKKRHLDLLNQTLKELECPSEPPEDMKQWLFSEFQISEEMQKPITKLHSDMAFAFSLFISMLDMLHINPKSRALIQAYPELSHMVLETLPIQLKGYIASKYINADNCVPRH